MVLIYSLFRTRNVVKSLCKHQICCFIIITDNYYRDREVIMQERDLEKNREMPVAAVEDECDKEHALRTLRLLEKGARQAFLDSELTIEDAKLILDQVKEAKEHCGAGDVSACVALRKLVTGLTEGREG